ncbi:MAG: ThuA domain-containing protein [Planctomycetaceae bacterium]
MKHNLFCWKTLVAVVWMSSLSVSAQDTPPIRILVITEGCCHDYGYQTKSMKQALADRKVAAEWTVVSEGGRGTTAEIDFYDDPRWAAGFDVVIHNECFANTDNPEYIRKITAAHKAGVNAVVIHCAMHTYRKASIDDWREFLGVTSRRHEHKSEYPVRVMAKDHPITKGIPVGWKTPKDELYVIEKVWPKTTVLASSVSEKTGKLHPVFWTSQYGKARVFGTTYGHSNETFGDKVFLDTLTRGIQWSAGRLKQAAR